MNRLGRAMADPTRSRILMSLIDSPSPPAVLSREHRAAALTALVDVTLAVDESAPCIDPACSVPGCCAASSSGDAS